jgi:hypothetical protein
MSRRNGILIAAVACGLGLLGGYRLHVLAEGAPADPSLFYAGTIEQDGVPASGEFTITLRVYDIEGGEMCEVQSEAEVDAGRFRIDASACADALRGEADAWAEVSFQGSDGIVREIEGRSKIGAVPYALEADHAVSASSAEGALASSLQALTDRVKALEDDSPRQSAFHAIKKSPQALSTGATAVVLFDQEQYDFGNEYDPATGTFVSREGGRYEFSCTVAFDIDTGTTGHFEAQLFAKGYENYFNGLTSDGFATTRLVSGVIQLAAGQSVQCWGYQATGSPQDLNVGSETISFEGRRFAR